MRLVHSLVEVQPASRSYSAIGVFDSVHRGHQHLIAGMVGAAHSTGDTAVGITFDRHPAVTLGYEPPPLLTTVEERAELLAILGLDVLIVLALTERLVRTSATDFVEALVHHLRLHELWGTADIALGHQRQGDISLLRCLGEESGFSVHVVEPLTWEGALVSSSRVRAALRAGDIQQVTGCLGRLYKLTGAVIRGRGLGRRLGIPTVNISPLPERMLPAVGVYACFAHTERLGTHPAVANVGMRPTVGVGPLVLEAHLLDFDAELYGQKLVLEFAARLRDEQAFPTLEALTAQIRDDVVRARILLDGLSGSRGAE